MNDQVEEIKGKVDIVELIGQRVSLKKAGRHYKGLCPFHSEKSPSFIVSSERQSYKCFGCGEGGDVFSFLQKYEGLSFLEALETLAQKTGVELSSYRPTEADNRKKTYLAILAQAASYYQYLLKEHAAGEEARQYLLKRKIGKEAREQFGLGYAPSQWRGVSDYLTKKKGYQEEDLLAVGLTIRSEGGRYYDRFRNRIMFPLKDHRGVIVGFAGRTLSADEREAKYINSPETSLYHKSRMLYGLWENREAIRKADQMIVVEGELDMIPSWQAKVSNVVAIKGSAFTPEMGQLVSRYTKNIVYALDADSAGQEAIKRAVKVAEPMELTIRVIKVTGGKDPGEVATESPAEWREMCKGAELYWDYLISSALAKHDPKSGDGASQISSEVVPAIAEIENAVVRAHYTQELAKRLLVPEESIYEEIGRYLKKKELSNLKQMVQKIEKGESGGRQEKLEKHLLALLLQFYPQLKDKLAELDSAGWGMGAVGKIVARLAKYQGEWAIAKFGAGMPAELTPVLDEAYLTDLSQVESPEKEWEKTRQEWETLGLREKLKNLTTQIGQYEQEGKEEELAKAQTEFARLSRQFAEVSG